MPTVRMLDNFDCCGLEECADLRFFGGTPEQAARSVLSPYGCLDIPNCAHIVFTQASVTRAKTGYGYTFAAYIKKHDLGAVVRTEPTRNPNTYHYVTAFTWTMNKTGIRRWARKLGIEVENY